MDNAVTKMLVDSLKQGDLETARDLLKALDGLEAIKAFYAAKDARGGEGIIPLNETLFAPTHPIYH